MDTIIPQYKRSLAFDGPKGRRSFGLAPWRVGFTVWVSRMLFEQEHIRRQLPDGGVSVLAPPRRLSAAPRPSILWLIGEGLCQDLLRYYTRESGAVSFRSAGHGRIPGLTR